VNLVRCSLFAVGGLVFSLACLPMHADIIVGEEYGLPGLTLGTVGTEAMACTNSACNGNGSVPFNSYVGNPGGAGGAVAAASAEFASNGVTANVVVDAQAYINDLSMLVDAGGLGGGSGTAYAAFTDVLTLSSFQGAADAFVQLNLDPTVNGPGGATYTAQLSLYWYGPGTFDAETDSACELTNVTDTGCSTGSTGEPGTPPTGITLPGLTDADTLLVFMSLYGDASTDGSVSDPDSVIITNLPPGVSIISAGGGTYTAATSAVPEPASWMMTAASAVGLLWMGRKRRCAKRAAADQNSGASLCSPIRLRDNVGRALPVAAHRR
jgi:hypothetical protein